MSTRRQERGRTIHTFVVRMVDNVDKGWTGIVTHVRSGRTASFRGFIGAIRFIDACMAEDETAPDTDATQNETIQWGPEGVRELGSSKEDPSSPPIG